MEGGLNQTQKFCKCIKRVRRTFRNEKGPIAVCVKSVLWKKNRTLRRFKCGRHGRVITQPMKNRMPTRRSTRRPKLS